MALLRAFLLLLGALAALTVGVAPAMAGSSPPACHDMAAMHHGSSAPAPAPASSDKAMKAMQCCIACVAAPVLRAPDRAAPASPRPVVAIGPAVVPTGERPSPEPGPPRPRLL